jgi:hypothetical protein
MKKGEANGSITLWMRRRSFAIAGSSTAASPVKDGR